MAEGKRLKLEPPYQKACARARTGSSDDQLVEGVFKVGVETKRACGNGTFDTLHGTGVERSGQRATTTCKEFFFLALITTQVLINSLYVLYL